MAVIQHYRFLLTDIKDYDPTEALNMWFTKSISQRPRRPNYMETTGLQPASEDLEASASNGQGAQIADHTEYEADDSLSDYGSNAGIDSDFSQFSDFD